MKNKDKELKEIRSELFWTKVSLILILAVLVVLTLNDLVGTKQQKENEENIKGLLTISESIKDVLKYNKEERNDIIDAIKKIRTDLKYEMETIKDKKTNEKQR